jgi:CBS domain-containing protein
MTFYVIDPHGYRLPYTPETFREIHRKPEKEAVEDFTDRKTLEWSKQPSDEEKQKERDKEKDGKEAQHFLDEFSTVTPRRLVPPLLAAQVMSSPVVSTEPTTTIRKAWDLLATNRFRHLPIVKNDKLVGVVSDRRLAREMINRLYKDDRKLHTAIEDVMVTHVLTTHHNTPISEIAAILIKERVGSMLIVTSDGKLEGIITRSDLLRTLTHRKPRRLGSE